MPVDPSRHYSDREVRLILKSAVELQQRGADRAGELTGGMSLVELEQAAVEVGVDPTFVRQAVAQLDVVRPPTGHNAFLGSPTYIVIERGVDAGVEPNRFDQLLDVVRAVTHEVGEVSTIGRQFGWKGKMDGVQTEVNVSAGDRRSTIRVRVELEALALGHFMLKGMLFGVCGGLIGSAAATEAFGAMGFAVAIGTVTTGYLWARTSMRTAATRHRARAQELIDALAVRSREIATEPAA